MCWRRWILITPEGCVASNPHVIIHREKVRCQKAIDMGVKLSPYDFDWPAALKGTGPWNIGCNVELRACDGGIIQTIDSFNREIEPRSIRTPDFIDYCPCCNGDLSQAKALLADDTSTSYVVLPNGRVLHTPNIFTEKLDKSMCIPLDVPAPIFEMNKQMLLLRRFAIPTQDWDSSESGSTDATDSCECQGPSVELHSHTGPIHVEVYHRPDVSIFLKALEKQRPKIWQLKPSGIVAGMMIPIWVGFEDPYGGNTDGEKTEEAEEAEGPEEAEGAEEAAADLGNVEMRFPVPQSIARPSQ